MPVTAFDSAVVNGVPVNVSLPCTGLYEKSVCAVVFTSMIGSWERVQCLFAALVILNSVLLVVPDRDVNASAAAVVGVAAVNLTFADFPVRTAIRPP